MPKTICIYDTTLRDGAQGEGISFSHEDKLEILRKLALFGIDFVEGGWPGANPKDDGFFKAACETDLGGTELVAFGCTHRSGIDPKDDQNLASVAACPTNWACIFGKTWDFHVTEALRISLEDNLKLIEDSVRYLKNAGKHVIFDAEHFFDGFRSNRDYALSAVMSAIEGGAEWIVLCDTNGGSLPFQVVEGVKAVKSMGCPKVGIHCHNDTAVAVASSLAAVEAGADMVQGTINGIGERCGNADLCAVMANLSIKMGYDLGRIDLTKLTGLSRFVGETINFTDPSLPYVGERAFAHKGGVHVSALQRDLRTYEHVPPESVGNRRRILISDMAGRASIIEKLKSMGMAADNEEEARILELVKDMEAKGYQFEGADASFELLVKRVVEGIEPPFTVIGFRLFMDEVDKVGFTSEASIKVMDSNGNIEHTASEGDGPVNALDNALRKALGRFFPVLAGIRLIDYKVRVLDGTAATAATVRVLMRSTDGRHSWTTVGVSENVIEASLTALVDSIEYAILKDGENR
jgi:2-isopropylmalate synthase